MTNEAALPMPHGRRPAGVGTTLIGPGEVEWTPAPGAPSQSFEIAPVVGSFWQDGFYICYARWYPGWMSAPHTYQVDRHSVTVSGVWTVGAGTSIDLEQTIPAFPGDYGFRKAGTSHYDGALSDAGEPAVFVLFGEGPAIPALTDPDAKTIYLRL
ncbi:hypothetical protein ACIA8C_01070 [Nocardia sp. NPDC051321]|uniref:hypothetical protein n=1 Tax=Nocardia sp. NPDC051321 TaxID=3364323 RepID=UPI00379D79DA